MNDKIDELHLIYKMIGNYGFCTVQELLNTYEQLKQQNEFLMKQDNILQSLMQWIYSELNYDKNWYNPDSEEYIGPKRYPDDTLDGFKIVIDKIKELKEER